MRDKRQRTKDKRQKTKDKGQKTIDFKILGYQDFKTWDPTSTDVFSLSYSFQRTKADLNVCDVILVKQTQDSVKFIAPIRIDCYNLRCYWMFE